MTTSLNPQAWSTTAASNNTADTGLPTIADSMVPTDLDNTMRGMMAALKRYILDVSGAPAAVGGTADVITITTNQVISTGHQAAGFSLRFKAGGTNTGAVTVAVDGLSAVAVERLDGTALRAGDLTSGGIYDLAYNATNGGYTVMNPTPAPQSELLTSGTVAAATLSIPLIDYTTYRGIKIILSGFRPATDGAALYCRFATDVAGTTYDATLYEYTVSSIFEDGTEQLAGSGGGSLTQIVMTAGAHPGNATTEGINIEVTLLNQTSTAFHPRIHWEGYYLDSSTPSVGAYVSGGGRRVAAQDVTGIRFLFSSGNISAGNYSVYGIN